MDITKLVTEENHKEINIALAIAKQDIAIQNAINALNELAHINRIEFQTYGGYYGISDQFLYEIAIIKDQLQNKIYGRF